MEENSYSSADEEEEVKEKDEEEVPSREESCTQKQQPSWTPSVFCKMNKEIHNFVGQDIIIYEALDSFAATTWPAAPALCQYLESHCKELNLEDKAVLEIGSGTGLVAIVAALLGAWVTATDLPDVLSNLRLNLSRNTRGKSRHTPQVSALSWSFDLEHTYPTSVYRYDYVLAADVVYHNDFLNELLATMKHFCQPGTTLLWANKVRMVTDVEFTEKFKKTFETKLLFEEGDMKIYMATYRNDNEDDDVEVDVKDLQVKTIEEDEEEQIWELDIGSPKTGEDVEIKSEADEEVALLKDKGQDSNKSKEIEDDEGEDDEGEDDEGKDDEGDDEGDDEEDDEDDEDEDEQEEPPSNSQDSATQETSETPEQKTKSFSWAASVSSSLSKDVYHYVGTDIVIYESFDTFGAVMWPGALALCSFLENNGQTVNLEGKLVLELGSGTGLVSIVASLLGGAVTATDLPEILGNLRANVMRNTRGRCRYIPQIGPLTWSFDIGRIYPAKLYRYDYVLAADVVYHHDFLDELLFTMKHFCHPGTTIIWSNKFRMQSDIEFSERFKKEFHTTVVAEDGDMKIFMGTFKE